MYVPNKREWRSAFEEIFSNLSQRKLPSSSYNSFTASKPLTLERNGHASYVCFKCHRFWRSSHGFVSIEYRLTFDSHSQLGYGDINLRVFGQKCQLCNGPYAPARFEAESIEHILQKLSLKVGQQFYGDAVDQNSAGTGKFPDEENPKEIGRGVHDSERCEACRENKCWANQSKPKRNPNGNGTNRANKNGTNRANKNRVKGIASIGPKPLSPHIQWILKFVRK